MLTWLETSLGSTSSLPRPAVCTRFNVQKDPHLVLRMILLCVPSLFDSASVKHRCQLSMQTCTRRDELRLSELLDATMRRHSLQTTQFPPLRM